MQTKISDFRQKEVIDIKNGARLGFVSDVEIDPGSGSITAIILPGSGKLFGLFGKDDSIIIPWEKIEKIGGDIILVNT